MRTPPSGRPRAAVATSGELQITAVSGQGRSVVDVVVGLTAVVVVVVAVLVACVVVDMVVVVDGDLVIVTVVTVEVGVGLFGFAETPNNVVASPLPVMELPEIRSGTV